MKSLRLFYILSILVTADCCFVQAQIITTIAGNGVQGYSGNGGPAILSENRGPWGTVVDKSGNIYFADPDNNVISKVDLNGVITKWAGTGVGGYSGDGGPAFSAELLGPSFLTSDAQGNMYFVDDGAIRVRKIDTFGIITTVAGNGLMGYSGDGGPAIAASFRLIFGVTPDNKGNLYISDYQTYSVRKVDASGIITTIAGTGVPGFSGDNGLATQAQLASPGQVGIDMAGNIYIPDGLNRRIRKIDISGIITTIVGDGTAGVSGDGGPAILARVGWIYQVHVDASGEIYLVDNPSNLIRKIDCSGIITTYAGMGIAGFGGDGGPAGSANLQAPVSIGYDATGNSYIADNLNYRVRKVTNTPATLNNSQPVINKICQGSNAIFTCNYLSANTYQWQISNNNDWISLVDNAQYAGSSTNTLTVISPPNSFSGNQYRCVIASSCNFYISNTDTLLVSGGPTSIHISTPSDSVCAGSTAVFSADVNTVQPDLIYDWQLNGVGPGTNSPVYSTNTLSNNDQVSCTLTDNSSCAAVITIESNIIQMHVTDSSESTIAILSPDNPFCDGSLVSVFANVGYGGSEPTFEWTVNGTAAGGNTSSFQSNTLMNGDIVTCKIISSLSCTVPVQSNSITMIGHPLPQLDAGNDTTITPGKMVQLNPMVTGNIISFAWSPSAGLDDAHKQDPVALPAVSTTYHLLVTDNNGCTASDAIKISVYSKLRLPNAFSPDGNGINDVFRIPPDMPVMIKRFSIYDRWGIRVFETSDASKGWDGKLNNIPQVIGTYVWLIEYVDPISGQSMKDSGTVILIR